MLNQQQIKCNIYYYNQDKRENERKCPGKIAKSFKYRQCAIFFVALPFARIPMWFTAHRSFLILIAFKKYIQSLFSLFHLLAFVNGYSSHLKKFRADLDVVAYNDEANSCKLLITLQFKQIHTATFDELLFFSHSVVQNVYCQINVTFRQQQFYVILLNCVHDLYQILCSNRILYTTLCGKKTTTNQSRCVKRLFVLLSDYLCVCAFSFFSTSRNRYFVFRSLIKFV